jgi:pimeloyl-ACP methyl ester carboxylesterase
MHREIRDSRVVTIGRAGHLSNVEQPEDFNRALLDFLATVYQQPRAPK